MNSCTSSFNKYIATYLVSLVLVLVFVAVATEIMVRYFVEPEDVLVKHVALFHQSNIQNAIFGDSHVAVGFTGEDEMVNLGFPSDSLPSIKWKVHNYYMDKSPNKVVLQADPHMFSTYRLKENEEYDKLFNATVKKEWGFKDFRIASNYHKKKLAAYWGVLLAEGQIRSKVQFEEDGWQRVKEIWTEKPENVRIVNARSRADLHTPKVDIQSHEYARVYESTVGDLLEKGADVCLVGFPVTNEYRANMPSWVYKNALNWFESLARKYRIKYLPYYDVFQNNPDYFGDQDHLSSKGAKVFSKIILSDCFKEE